MSYQLEALHINKAYAGHIALSDVSISVKKGSIFGLLGPNGAGKSSLIRIINRITAPDAGELLFCGRPMLPTDVYTIGYLPEERGLYKKMKTGEQAIYLARLKGLSRADAIAKLKVWFIKFGIEDWWDKRIEELSKGMAQKIQFIVTLVHQPNLLIFDEPFSGFDPINVELLKTEILQLKKEGCTIIFSTHNMASVEELCDDIALINKSKCLLTGSVEEVRRSKGKPVYELLYEGYSETLQTSLLEFCENIDQEKRLHQTCLKMTFKDKVSSNHLLSLILPQVQVIEFKECIATMNDIFLDQVRNH